VLKPEAIVSALLEDEEPSPEDLLQATFRDKPQYFVQLDPADKAAAERHGVMSYRHRVLDRFKIVSGKYAIVADKMDYHTAFKLAKSLNDAPHKSDLIAGEHKPVRAPVHDLGGGSRRTF